VSSWRFSVSSPIARAQGGPGASLWKAGKSPDDTGPSGLGDFLGRCSPTFIGPHTDLRVPYGVRRSGEEFAPKRASVEGDKRVRRTLAISMRRAGLVSICRSRRKVTLTVRGPDPPSWTLDRWSAKRSGKEIKCHAHDLPIHRSFELRRCASSALPESRSRRSPESSVSRPRRYATGSSKPASTQATPRA